MSSSAEEAAEELQEGETQVNNIVNSFRLTETNCDKKTCWGSLKGKLASPFRLRGYNRAQLTSIALYRRNSGYMKAVKAKLQETKPEEVEAFEKGAAAFAKK